LPGSIVTARKQRTSTGALREYRRKRDFRSTKEPAGKDPGREVGHRFVVQKHAARNLHYDLRLEHDGVLKSWAVPKGPSADSSVVRLAVQVEDHPLEYYDFEGTIPKGDYGGGTVMVWDVGTWTALGDIDEGLRRGSLKFSLNGKRLHGGWALFRTKSAAGTSKPQWLLRKEKDRWERKSDSDEDLTSQHTTSILSRRSMDEIATASDDKAKVWQDSRSKPGKAAQPSRSSTKSAKLRASKRRTAVQAASLPNAVQIAKAPTISPQLATTTASVPTGDGWLHEIKFDGYRLMCYLNKGTVRLITRGGHDWTAKYQEVADSLSELNVNDAVLDGELIAFDIKGRSTFNAMQNATRRSGSRRLELHLFDVPYCNGYDLRRTPLIDRKVLLKEMLLDADEGLHFSDHIIGHGEKMFREACQHGLEGTISKRVDSQYVSSRTSSWLKNKCKHRQEFVIGGYSDPEGARSGFGALLVGVYEGKKLVYCGRVGTGFDQATLSSLYKQLLKLQLAKTAFDVSPTGADAKGAHWVKPDLVAELEFSEWTDDNRLRHPVYLGLRADKPASRVVREHALTATPAKVTSTNAAGLKTASGVTVAGVALSNPDRMLYPKVKVTKRNLAEFYEAIAERILPHIINRPLTIVRCPKGLPSKCFYQRHMNETLPPTLRGVRVCEGDEVVQYIVLDDLAGLVSLVQLSTLEIHPWGAMADAIDRPNRLIFDLDPGPGVPWKRVVEAAMTTRDILASANLQSFVQTSGGKGLHVIVPIMPRADWDEAKAFCKAVAQVMATREPKKYTATLSKSKREGKVFIDYLRNGKGATSVASYSARARDGASVATPLSWEELPDLRRADAFTVKNLPQRLQAQKADPWKAYFKLRQYLPAATK